MTAPISCPPSTSSQFYSCGEEGDTLCQSWVNSPVAGWLLDDNMWLDEDSLGTCVVVDSMYVHHSLTWYTTTELGCQQTNHMCWGVGALDSLGQCTEVPCSPPPPPPCDAFLCEDSLACNYGIAVCCLDSCVFPESIGANELAFDSLVFCQSWTPCLLGPVALDWELVRPTGVGQLTGQLPWHPGVLGHFGDRGMGHLLPRWPWLLHGHRHRACGGS